MGRGRMFLGLAFLFMGGLLLLNNLSLLPISLAELIWPLILLIVGLLFLLRGLGRGAQWRSDSLSLPAEGVERVRLKLDHAAGRIVIDQGAEGDAMLEGEFVGGVASDVNREGSRASIRLSIPSDSWMDFPFRSRGHEWSLKLSPDLVYEIEIDSAAGEAELNLEALQVQDLRLKTGASSTRAELSSLVERGTVRVDAGAASVDLHVPEGVSARIRSEAGLAEIDIDSKRFEHHNGGFQSPEFRSASKRLDIDIHAGVGKVRVR